MAIKQSSTWAIQTATTDKVKVIKIIAWVVLGLLVSASGILYEFYPETFTAIKEYATSQWVTYSAILLTIASSTGSIAGIRLGQIFYDARAVKSAMAIDNARIEAIENKRRRSAIQSLINLEQSTSVDYETYLNIQKEKDKLKQKWREPKT